MENEVVTQFVGNNKTPFHRKWLLGALIFVIILTSGIVFAKSHRSGTNTSVSESILGPQQTPTPYPLQELTIPHLRERSYVSRLRELEVYQETANYTSYLTQYDSDGLQIKGLLTKPAGEMPTGGWPAVVFIHGYIPPAQYQTTERYMDYVDYLARNGFVVFKIDLRGHGESEGTPGGAYYSADYIIDVLSAYVALQTSDFVNPQKIGLWGHSMAGNIVMRSAAAKPEIPAVVIWAGAVYSYEDMRKYGISDASYQRPVTGTRTPRSNTRQQISERYGQPNSENIFWRNLAPVYFLDDLKGAIQLHHASDDEVVNIEYSRELNNLLDRTEVPHELYEYESGGHDISGDSFVTAMERTVAFYKKYLKAENL